MQIDTAAISEYDILGYIPWLEKSVFGNSLHAYILTALGFVVIWVLLSILRRYVVKKLGRPADAETTAARQFVQGLLETIRPWVFPLVAFYIATQRLTIVPTLEKFIRMITMAAVMLVVIRAVGETIVFLITRTRLTGRSDDPVVKSTNQNIATLVKIGVWTGGIMFFLDNQGFNVGTFVAGLGIGGIAIALAAQAILGDTFSSFAIALDKPFEVGDFIIIDDLQGTVEHIGLKTTRVRSLGGELLVMANSDLTKSRIKNYKRMYQRRVVFRIGMTYDTSPDQLRRVQEILRNAVEEQKPIRFDRAHFASFGASSLDFEVVYFVLEPDFNHYMDIQQAINLRIHEQFTKEGLNMAFPTRTIISQKEPK